MAARGRLARFRRDALAGAAALRVFFLDAVALQVGLAPRVGGPQCRQRAGIGGDELRPCLGRQPGQGLQRQAQAHRRVAGDQQQAAGADLPALRHPARLGLPALHRQHEAARRAQAAIEYLQDAGALLGVLQARVGGIDVDRQLALAHQVMERVLVGVEHIARVDFQALGQGAHEVPGLVIGGRVDPVGARRRQTPGGLAVAPPIQGVDPARQRLAGVPLALAVGQQALRGKVIAHAQRQLVGPRLLGRADRRGVPFRALHVVDGDEGGLATHGQAHVAGLEPGVHRLAQGIDLLPLLLAVGLGDARRFIEARHLHLVAELDLTFVHRAGDRRRGLRLGGGAERDMALARQQAGGRVQADPAGAGHVDLAPGMQVGEVHFRAAGAVQ